MGAAFRRARNRGGLGVAVHGCCGGSACRAPLLWHHWLSSSAAAGPGARLPRQPRRRTRSPCELDRAQHRASRRSTAFKTPPGRGSPEPSTEPAVTPPGEEDRAPCRACQGNPRRFPLHAILPALRFPSRGAGKVKTARSGAGDGCDNRPPPGPRRSASVLPDRAPRPGCGGGGGMDHPSRADPLPSALGPWRGRRWRALSRKVWQANPERERLRVRSPPSPPAATGGPSRRREGTPGPRAR